MKALDVYRKITNLNGFTTRQSQAQMVSAIDKCLTSEVDLSAGDGHNIILIEAPTGTGKSLAYLASGVINSLSLDKKLVITTATKTLQNQLINKDIPNFIQGGGVKFSFTLAKGRSNYLCPYNLDLNLDLLASDMLSPLSESKTKLKEIRKFYQDKLWDGDLDQSPINLDNETKNLIITDKERCLNYTCPYNQKDNCNCPFYLNKEKLKNSDVVVTNHSLLLADLATGGGNVLPFKPDEYILCIDEAHNFENIAIGSFTGMFELRLTLAHCQNLAKFIYNPQTQNYAYTDIALCESISGKSLDLATALEDFLLLLSQNTHLFNEDNFILNDYLNPDGSKFCEFFVNFAYLSYQIALDLAKLQDKLKDQLKQTSNNLLQTSLDKLGFYIGVIDTIMTVSKYVMNQDDSRYNCNARWIKIKVSPQNELDFIVYAGLTHVGKLLHELLWSKVYAAILTSATLAIGRDFSYYQNKLGLNKYPKLNQLKLDSNFIYANQAQIVVPRFKAAPEYSSLTEFNQELKNYLEDALDYDEPYGVLVIFFNRKMAQNTYDLLPFRLRSKILLQMDYSNNKSLIEEHKNKIANKTLPSFIKAPATALIIFAIFFYTLTLDHLGFRGF